MIKKKKIVSGLFWNYVDRFSKEGVSLLISVILANLLDPEDFGAIALLTVFIAISNAISVSGFNIALIQKKEIDEVDRSTVFYFSFLFAWLSYGLLFILSPYIADFYHISVLKKVLRVIALTLPLGAYNSVQMAMVARELKFRLQFISSFISSVVSGCLGIFGACMGWGIWALVLQQLSSVVVSCIALQVMVRWYPHRYFSLSRLKGLFAFGWKIAVSSVVDSLYNNAFSLVIGRKYSAADLAYYNRGQQLPLMLSINITSSISTVMLPVFSQMQNDKEALKAAVRRSVAMCSMVMFPLIMGLGVVSKPLILLVYGEKWASVIPYMQLFCLAFLFYPVNMANTQALNGMGRSDLFLTLNIIKRLIGLFMLVFFMQYGVFAIAVGYAITALLGLVINIYPNRKLLHYGFWEQFMDFWPSLIMAAGMTLVCMIPLALHLNHIVTIVIQVVIGAVVYIGGLTIFHYQPMLDLLSSIKAFVRRKLKSDSSTEK